MNSVYSLARCCILAIFVNLIAYAEANTEISGLVIPRDSKGMYIRNDDGQFEVTWTNRTKVALVANTRQFRHWKPDRLEYRIHSSKEVIKYPIPDGPITGIKTSRGGMYLDVALKEAEDENWISEHGLKLYFNQKPQREQLATHNEPHFIGLWNPKDEPRTLSINSRKYEISLKKGGQTQALLYNLLSVNDCKPFVSRATVFGEKKGNVLIADEIHVLPIGDQAAHDDPKLPRYLFIGDSISGNYDRGLREALKGEFNLHHPPTNCGPVRNGAKNIHHWLGAYEQPGRHWDVISFNFGHWNAGSDKASYQRDLETVIAALKKTKAKLIWVTTCPVPNGFPKAGSLSDKGNAPRRTSGVMQKYINPWALEVIKRYPCISTCDQWQFVKNNEGGLFTDWWAGTDVHFKGQSADALGAFLAEHIKQVFRQ